MRYGSAVAIHKRLFIEITSAHLCILYYDTPMFGSAMTCYRSDIEAHLRALTPRCDQRANHIFNLGLVDKFGG